MKFTLKTALISLATLSLASFSLASPQPTEKASAVYARAYESAIDYTHSLYARELDARDELIHHLLAARANVNWHDPKMLSGGKSKTKKAQNAAAKVHQTAHASAWGDQHGFSHVTIHDAFHKSGERKDGKPGDPREHMTVVGHHGDPHAGSWHHVYEDGTHKPL